MIETMLPLLYCHFVGDYVLQSDFIARTKGRNWWHLLVHSVLYSLPFYLTMGPCWQHGVIIITHFLVDAGKARHHFFSYTEDQLLHLLATLLYLFPKV